MSETIWRVIGREVGRLVVPLHDIAADPIPAAARLLSQAGWSLPGLTDAADDLAAAASSVLAAADAIAGLAEPADIAAVAVALTDVQQAFAALDDVPAAFEAALGPVPPGDVTPILGELGEDLAHALAVGWLRRFHPAMLGAAAGLGLVTSADMPPVEAAGQVLRPAQELPRIEPAAISALLTDPVGHLQALYEVGAPLVTGDAEMLAALTGARLHQLLAPLGGQLAIGALAGPSADADARRRVTVAIPLPAPGRVTEGPVLRFDADLVSAADTGATGQRGPAIEIAPSSWPDASAGAAGWTVAAGRDGPLATVRIGADGELSGGAALPKLTLTVSRDEGGGVVIGAPQASRFELPPPVVELWLDPTADDVGAGVRLAGARLVVGSAETDSFVGAVLGGLSLDASADLSISWSRTGGIALGGAGGLEVVLPIDASLAGIVFVPDLIVRLAPTPGGLAVELRTTITGGLGPVSFAIEGLGLGLDVAFPPDRSGNLGFADATLRLLPPTGVGFSIDVAGVASGGGYLAVDPPNYSGVGELSMLGVGLTAVGQITTELPGRAPGWSLFLSVSATFTGVQLGFGFTLNGVGGLVGINRSVDTAALGEGVRTGALDRLLFPDDPIADAPQIVADMEAIFPVAEGQYVFGPIAQIGWGTPTLVAVDLGVIVELPDPLVITLLGSLEAVLPTKAIGLLVLRVDVAGSLNVTEGTLAIDASLRDSQVAGLNLTGDMAVRASFLERPGFLVSFGGFHPAYDAPADFPRLARLGVALDTGDDLRVQLAGYFALTSNTVQFGAEFGFWAKAVGFTAEGGTSLDTLVQFQPFGFLVDFALWASVSAGKVELLGVRVDASLSGPNPWHVAGYAEFRLLGVKAKLEIEATVGDVSAEDPPETVVVAPLLLEELGLPDAWSAVPPGAEGDCVVMADHNGNGELLVHPAGRLEVRQRLVPLGVRLERYGNAKLGDADTFELAEPELGGVPVTDADEVTDDFATGQFYDLTATEALESPSFVPMAAGLRMGDDTLAAGPSVTLVHDQEVVYRDPNGRDGDAGAPERYTTPEVVAVKALAAAPALVARRRARLPHAGRPESPFGVHEVAWVAAGTHTGAIDTDLTPPAGVSFLGARFAVLGAGAPQRRVLVPAYEIAAAP